MRRSGRITSAIWVVALAAAAWAGDPPVPAAAIRAARDAVAKRPEFHYGAQRTKSFIEEWFDSLGQFIEEFREAHPWVFVAILAGLFGLMLVLVIHIVWTMRMARRAEWEGNSLADLDAAMRHGDPTPFRVRAIEHAAAGRFDEAVRDLYAALLLTLDRRGSLRYAAHKALLDYRIEAARDADARRALELCAVTYLPGSFGRRPPDRAHFDELLGALDALGGTPR